MHERIMTRFGGLSQRRSAVSIAVLFIEDRLVVEAVGL